MLDSFSRVSFMKLFRWAIVLLFVVVCYWGGSAHADSCVTSSNNTFAPWIMLGGTSYKDIVWTGPSNNLVSSISVTMNYSKNAGALLHFYLNKLNSGFPNVNVINDNFEVPLSNYSYTVNNIGNFNGTPVNGTWRLTMAHDALYQSANQWGPQYSNCASCHPGAQFNGWSMTVCYYTACNLLINSFTQSASQFYPGNGQTVHYASTISGNDGSTIYWSLNVGGRGYSGTGTTVSVDWDGKDATGQLVAQGNYQAVLTTWTSTSCQKTQSLTVYVNRTCSLSVTSFTQNKTIFNPFAGETVTFGGGYSDSIGGTKTWVINVSDRTFTGTGTISAAWNGKNTAGAYVADANYPATLRVSTAGCSDAKTTYVATGAPKQSQSDAPNSCSEAGDVPNTLLFESGSNTNLVTGNLAHSQELFSTRGIELATGIDLNYSSLNTEAGVLGVGWRHSYEGGLTVNGDSTVVIKDGDGGSRKYVPIGGNLYHSQMGDSSTMVKNGGGTYTITFINGSKKTFNVQGKLTSIKDRFNNTATIAYPSSSLTTITDPASRVTRLEFVGGKLDAVVDPKGNRYTFFYSSGMLWKVVNPVADPAVTTEQGYWEYTYINGRLKTKRDPGGNIFQYSYYPDGRVQSVIDPDGIANPTDHTRSYIYPPNLTTVDTGVITEKDSGTWSYQIDGVNRTLKNRIAAVTGAETSYTYHFNRPLKNT